MNALGIYSQDGDRLMALDFRWTQPQEKFQQMLQDWLKLPRSERWPVHLQDHISMFVYDCSGLLFVAFTLENMQPLQVFESLRAITVFLQAAFGGLTEEKVRGNLHMVTELINECMDYGIVTQLQQHIVLERLHSRYLPPKQPMFDLGRPGSQRASHFRSILPTENAGTSEVYVDQIEVVSCTMGASGHLVAAACQGTLQMKSFLAQDSLSALLKMHTFHCPEIAAQYAFMQGGNNIHCFLEDLQLHQEAELQAQHTNGNCQILAPALRGERVVMTYSVDLAKQGGFVPPVAASLVCECDADYNKKVNLTIVLRNNIAHRGVQFVTLELPLPRYVEKATCTPQLDQKGAVCSSDFDKDSSILTVKIKTRNAQPTRADSAIKAKGSVQLDIPAMLQRPYEASTFNRGLGPMNLSYQVQSLAVSGMKVCYMDYIEPNGAKYMPMGKDGGPGKWLRTVVTSSSTTFRV